MSRTHAPLALLVALTLALTGCGGVDKRGHKSDTAHSPTAAFASEEEALAAAVAVYDHFTRTSDLIAQEGGRDADRLSMTASGPLLEQSVEGFGRWLDQGWRQIGSRSFHDATLQQLSKDGVVIYLCEDISQVDVVDANGTSVVDANRSDSNYLQVGFETADDGLLRVSSRDRWDARSC